MPELVEYRQLPARSYPGFHRLSDRFVHYLSEAEQVVLSPALAQVLFQAALAKRTLVLGTGENAVLSPFVVHEMRRFGHRWCFQRDGVTCDAMSGRTISYWNQLDEPVPPGAGWLPPARPEQSFAAINVEVVGHHRAREDLVVGGMAEALATGAGGPNLDAMGMREPLVQSWSRAEVTRHARTQMPRAEIVRASSPGGAFVDLVYERSDQGVIERMNGRLVLGPWDHWASRAGEIAEQMLVQFTKLCTPVVMTTSLLDVEPDGGQGIRQRVAEQPLAWLAGPDSLSRAKVDVSAVADRYVSTRVGSRSRESLLVSFPPSHGNPREQLNRLLVEVALHGADQVIEERVAHGHRDGDQSDSSIKPDGPRTWHPRVVE